MRTHLMPGEKELWFSYPGKRYRLFIFLRDFAISILLGFGTYFFIDYFNIELGKFKLYIPIAISLLMIILGIYNQILLMLVRYRITNKRVIIKKGLINRRLMDIKLKNILETEVKQNVNQLMMGCGTIFIYTANDVYENYGNGEQTTPRIENIDNPFEIHNLLKNALFNAEKNKDEYGYDYDNRRKNRYYRDEYEDDYHDDYRRSYPRNRYEDEYGFNDEYDDNQGAASDFFSNRPTKRR